MAVKDIFKISRKTFFNPAEWFAYGEVKNNTKIVTNAIKDVYQRPEPIRKETFEQSIKRLGLTPTDIEQRKSQFLLFTIIFFLLGLLLFAYSIYLLIHNHTFNGWLLATSAAALFFVQAFRFHFWFYQMQQRRLGVTFAEWRNNIFASKGNTK